MILINYGYCVVFFIEKLPKLNIEDYEYTIDSSFNVILTKYIGVTGNTIIPDVEEE